MYESTSKPKKNSDFSRLPADLWRNWREKMFRLLYVNRLYHMSQSLVSKYPISKWNLSLRILTRIEIHNIIIEKKLSRSIIKFFSSIFRVGKCFSQFWEKKSRKFGLGLGPNFCPKLSLPPPKKKPHWLNPLLFLNTGVQWQM